MAQTSALLTTLKRALKSQGKTYADVAVCLELTEASVKRLFAEQHFSLLRLEKVCQMLEMEISDLVQLMNTESSRLKQLSVDQEKKLTADLSLLLVTVCVLNKWSLKEIVDCYHIDELVCVQKLAALDRLKIIDLLPGNRIKLRIAPNFSWLENGPIQIFFQKSIAEDYFKSRFSKEDECLMVSTGMLSKHSNADLQRKMTRLAREFEELNRDDSNLPLSKRQGTTMVLAIRDWQFGVFGPLKK